MSKKTYRRPKVLEGQMKFQRGKIDGDVDMCIFYGDSIPRCDRALVMNAFGSGHYSLSTKKTMPSFLEELEARGYDLDTLKFTIKKKSNDNGNLKRVK